MSSLSKSHWVVIGSLAVCQLIVNDMRLMETFKQNPATKKQQMDKNSFATKNNKTQLKNNKNKN